MDVPAVPNPEPGELKLRSYLADVIEARDAALGRVAKLERQNLSLVRFACDVLLIDAERKLYKLFGMAVG